jgi:signal transduction histidine kinase
MPRARPGCTFRPVNVRRLVRRHAGDALVVALTAAAVVEIVVSDLPGWKFGYAAAACAWSLVLLLRHRFPLAAPAATSTMVAVASFFIADQIRSTAVGVCLLIVAAWWMGAGNDRRRAVAGLAAMYAGVQVTTAHFGDLAIGDVIFTSLLVAAPWLAGQAFRSRALRARELGGRAARLEKELAESARSAVADERARIARELHDVIAHSISVMTVQAGAARLLLDDEPDQAEHALLRVEETGRDTLAEMRRLLGVLRRDMVAQDGLEPRPSLDRLDALLDHYRAAGLEVELDRQGPQRTLPAGLDQAAYRVVQEALTNTLKHAGRTRVRVRLAFSPDELALDIEDDGAGAATTVSGTGGGHGLIGMRERIAIYGGTLATGPRDGRGFAVGARFPLDGRLG